MATQPGDDNRRTPRYNLYYPRSLLVSRPRSPASRVTSAICPGRVRLLGRRGGAASVDES